MYDSITLKSKETFIWIFETQPSVKILQISLWFIQFYCFEVGGHWVVVAGMRKLNDHAEPWNIIKSHSTAMVFFSVQLFVGSAWSIPITTANDLQTSKDFSIPDFIHYIYFPILILEKEPVFSLLNVQCWYHFYNVLDWGLNPDLPHSKSALYH